MRRLLQIIKNLKYTFVAEKRPLGRWCHDLYTKTCNSDIKGFLANVDNSGSNTGLCKKTNSEVKSKNAECKLRELGRKGDIS